MKNNFVNMIMIVVLINHYIELFVVKFRIYIDCDILQLLKLV